MTTPSIFILFPLVLSVFLYFIQKRTRLVTYLGVGVSIFLMLFAFFQDFDAVWRLGPISIEIRSTLELLGRSFILGDHDKYFITFIFFCSALWFGATRITELTPRFIPFGLAISAILTGALAVEPFLFSAILVEIAILVSIPLLLETGKPVGKGVLRFLVYQSIAMPLILFGGWLLGGIEASPSDTARLLQSVIFLGIGFTLWLAVVPFHSWVPQLSRDIHPYINGFILGILPVVTMLIMVDFISGLVWLRESPYLQPTLFLVGTIMIASTGVFALLEKDMRRLVGYAILLESGYALLAIGLQSETGIITLFLSFLPRLFALALISLSLSIFASNDVVPDHEHLTGLIRRFPIASASLIVGLLSMAGLPLLGGFPTRLALLEKTAIINSGIGIWAFVGSLLFLLSILRVVNSLTKPVFENWTRVETNLQSTFLILGIIALLIFGLFPNLFAGLLSSLFVNLPILR